MVLSSRNVIDGWMAIQQTATKSPSPKSAYHVIRSNFPIFIYHIPMGLRSNDGFTASSQIWFSWTLTADHKCWSVRKIHLMSTIHSLIMSIFTFLPLSELMSFSHFLKVCLFQLKSLAQFPQCFCQKLIEGSVFGSGISDVSNSVSNDIGNGQRWDRYFYRSVNKDISFKICRPADSWFYSQLINDHESP